MSSSSVTKNAAVKSNMDAQKNAFELPSEREMELETLLRQRDREVAVLVVSVIWAVLSNINLMLYSPFGNTYRMTSKVFANISPLLRSLLLQL